MFSSETRYQNLALVYTTLCEGLGISISAAHENTFSLVYKTVS